MLEVLTQGFTNAREKLSGVRELSEENIEQSLRDVRMSLLEADVDFQVVKDFLGRVKERALGEKVSTRVRDASGRKIRVTPGQHFVKICEEELTGLMGPVDTTLATDAKGVHSLMLVGLQGVGKTTVAGKLARHLQKQKRRPLLVAADVQRPAAVEQLVQLGERIGVPVHRGAEGEAAPAICAAAAARAKSEGFDAIVYDTAGRLAIDDDLMRELEEIHEFTSPANTLLVCDSLMGRDAVNVAQAFSERIDLDGLVLTKLDGDARGGAALGDQGRDRHSRSNSSEPARSLDRLEALPARRGSRRASWEWATSSAWSRDFEEVVDEKEAEEDAERLLKGKFGLDDLLKQLKTIQKMGPLREVFAKLPMFGGLADQVEGSELTKVESLIHSMTPGERSRPETIDGSRAKRIARGSGRRSKDVRDLIERFTQMRELMGNLGKGGMLNRIPGMGGGDLDPSALLAGAGGGGFPAGQGRRVAARSRTRAKGKRKQARKARKKNRRR